MDNKKISLQELADVISAQSGTTKKFTDSFLRELVVVIQEYLEKDGVVKVKGLGTFKLLWIEARKSVNVATKESIILPAHYKLSFIPEESVKMAVNSDENVISGGAVVINDSEKQAEPIESEIDNPAAEEVEVPVEEKKIEKESTKEIEVVQVPSKKTNRALVSVIIILLLIILCLSVYIFSPQIKSAVLGMIKPKLIDTKLEVVSSIPTEEAVDSTVVIPEIIEPKDSILDDSNIIEEVAPIEKVPEITTENYTSSMAMNAPTREIVTVIDGSRLTMVAYRAYGHKAFWVYVYDANRDKLKSPSDVEKGMQLRIADLPLSLVNSKSQICLDKAYELARKYDK